MKPEIRFCTTSDGVRIAFATAGQGPALIQVPGWVSHLELQWALPDAGRFWETLARHFFVVAYDKRGTGLSDRDVTDFSLDARLRDLEAVIEHLKLRRVVLYGISEGGQLAIACAVRHPRRVSRLVLYGAYSRGSALGPKETIDALVALVRAQWGLGSATLSNIFVPGAPQREVRWFIRLQQEGATAEGAAAMLQANLEIDVSELLGQVRCPTLVMHARGDLAIPFELGRELAGRIPGARFVPLEGTHAFLPKEAWVQTERTVLDFLAQEEQASGRETAAPRGSEPGPLTVMFTDMESSTALTQRLGDARAQEVLRTHNTIVRDALKAHGGSEIKHTGDGIMASFPSASRALECAIAIQRAVAALVREDPEMPLRVRIGLNAGEPVVEDEDLFGTAVQLAARICAHAEPGQIVVPTVVRELAAGKGFLLADLDEIALRGFEDPVRLYEVRWEEVG
jgi:class 3 adenylate cyclase